MAHGLPSGDANRLSSIFVAPEFLFTAGRPASSTPATHAVSATEYGKIADTLHRMSAKTPGMLIVPGTIVYSEMAIKAGIDWSEAIGATIHAKAKKIPIQGVVPSKLAARYNNDIAGLTYLEQHIAGKQVFGARNMPYIIRNVTHVYFSGNMVSTYGKKAYCEDFQDDLGHGIYIPGRQAGVATVDGIKYGVEICYDHDMGVLQAVCPNRDLDLHIICSGFVANQARFSCAKEGGYTLHASTNAFYSKVLKKVKPRPSTRETRKFEDLLKKNPAWKSRNPFQLSPQEISMAKLTADEVDKLKDFAGYSSRMLREPADTTDVEMAKPFKEQAGYETVEELGSIDVGGASLRYYEISL